MSRVMNFNGGPAALPLSAIERARDELVDFEQTGMSILEHSHRDAPYERVHREAISLTRELLSVPGTHDILLMQGGARMQFAVVPMNLLTPGRSADYVVTGTWAKSAFEEASLVGQARLAGTTEEAGRWTRVPALSELSFDPNAAYVHITSNNTLFGTQWVAYPDTGHVPLVVDATSDLFTRPIDFGKTALVYAAAQKNFGPAGVTAVIVRKDLIESGRKDIPQIFRYASFAKSESLFNTPPTFSIYMMRNTLSALHAKGGVPAIAKESGERSALLYDAIDRSPEFFLAPVERASRSQMNVVFRLPTEALEKAFLTQAAARGIVGIKGHRSVGGIRASLYAAVELEHVRALVDFMESFRRSA
jgi:phosphoserine aminotransferase